MKYKDVCDYATDNEIDLVLFNNPKYENSIVGITTDDRVVYDLELMIKDLMKEDNISYDEALEFIEYNTIRAIYNITNAPIIIRRS